MKRNRYCYAVAIAVVIGLGLLSRRCPGLLPSALGKYPGDALWALMVFGGIGLLRPRWRSRSVALAALVISAGVEFSKWYRAPWLESVRHTLAGRLVLGSVFSWRNIAAYAVGILLGWALETAIRKLSAGRKA